jgi:membrane dipeptidase
MHDEYRGDKATDYFDRTYHTFKNEILLNRAYIMQCQNAGDFQKAEKEQKCGAILTVEGGSATAGNIERIWYMAALGVKIMTLTWNGTNEIGDGANVKDGTGLTEFGKKAVAEMEYMGIVVDVYHASASLFYDVASIAKKPFIATHSNSRTVCNHRRNLTDEQFCIIRDTGGIVGLNFCKFFLKEDGNADLADIMKHIDHFLSLGGENVLSIGSDFDGTDMPKNITGIESMEPLYDALLKQNYSQSLVDAIFFGNAYKFFTSL